MEGRQARTPNLLKPSTRSSASFISTSSLAETSAVEGPSESTLRVRDGAMLAVWAERGVRL